MLTWRMIKVWKWMLILLELFRDSEELADKCNYDYDDYVDEYLWGDEEWMEAHLTVVNYVDIDANILCTIVIAGIDNDGVSKVIVDVSYFFDHEVNPEAARVECNGWQRSMDFKSFWDAPKTQIHPRTRIDSSRNRGGFTGSGESDHRKSSSSSPS